MWPSCVSPGRQLPFVLIPLPHPPTPGIPLLYLPWRTQFASRGRDRLLSINPQWLLRLRAEKTHFPLGAVTFPQVARNSYTLHNEVTRGHTEMTQCLLCSPSRPGPGLETPGIRFCPLRRSSDKFSSEKVSHFQSRAGSSMRFAGGLCNAETSKECLGTQRFGNV